jgi:phage terminase large subunit
VEVSLIYEKTKEEIYKSRRIVHQGGQSSGKTVNILAALTDVAAREKKVITVTSMSFPHLRAGAMRDFERFVMPSFAKAIKQYRKTDHVVLFKSGGLIEFKTYETEYDARGAKRDILFVNEANTFDYMTWFQLDSRSNVSIVDYNPTAIFWVHERVIGEKRTAFFRSWHEHNPWLSEEKHNEIEAIKDPELWRVYARGMTGNIRGVIYPDWVQVDSIQWEKPFFAIDFGWTNDPTAIVKIERKKENIYVQEIAYVRGEMTPQRIRDVLNSHGFTRNSVLYCEHEPGMIKQLKMLGLTAVSAKKGPGSLNTGIEKVKEYRVFYIGQNIKSEREKYIWEVDDLGEPTNTPVDAHNHALDAIRYGVYSHFYRG